MRQRFAFSSAALPCSLLVCVGVASATELEWSAPESCGRDAFVQQVEDNLQRPLAQRNVERIRVTVAQSARSEWTLEFSLGEAGSAPPASRKLTGASCEDVSRAGAVAVAMALHSRAEQPAASEPMTVVAPPLEAAPPTPEVAAPIEAPLAAVAVLPDAGATGPPYRWPLQLQLLGDVSLLGTPSYGLGAGLGLGRGRWEVTLAAAWLPTTELRTSDALGLRLGALLGLASGCFTLGGPPATPRACLSYELGAVVAEGSGSGLRITREQRAVWHALRPELGLGVPLASELELRLFAGAALGLTRARFVFDEGRTAHEIPRVSARGAVVLAWTP